MGKSVLEQLIDLQAENEDGGSEASERRRTLLRSSTDSFIVAADRFGRRDMEFFDLLLSRTAKSIDQHVRKLIALTLVRAGARDEHVKMMLSEASHPNAQFLRRSVVQTRQDILAILQEQIGGTHIEGDPSMSDGTSLTLPTYFCEHLYAYISQIYIEAISPKVGKDRTGVVQRTVDRGKATILQAATQAAQDEIVSARKMVREWVRRQSINDDLLGELLEARAMTEFIFALSAMLETDIASTIRILNDRTFESLATAYKAKDIRRSVFAKTIFGFKNRDGDKDRAERILALYDKLNVETAERAMRFWRLRTTEYSDHQQGVAQNALAS